MEPSLEISLVSVGYKAWEPLSLAFWVRVRSCYVSVSIHNVSSVREYQVWDLYEGLYMCNMSYYYSHVTALDSWVH